MLELHGAEAVEFGLVGVLQNAEGVEGTEGHLGAELGLEVGRDGGGRATNRQGDDASQCVAHKSGRELDCSRVQYNRKYYG